MVNSIESDLKGNDNYLANLSSEVNNLKDAVRNNKEKEKAPEVIKVRNKPCIVGGMTGIYEGERISGGKNNYDNPKGKGRFISNDGKILDGQWNDDGIFLSGKMTAKGKSFNITKAYVYANDKTKLLCLHGTGNVKGFKYDCDFNENLEFSKITYKGVTLKFVNENGVSYLENKKGDRLAMPPKFGTNRHVGTVVNSDPDWIAVGIVKLILRAKNVINSGKKIKEICTSFIGGSIIRAEIENQKNPVDLMNTDDVRDHFAGTTNTYAITKWLTKSRKDFGF